MDVEIARLNDREVEIWLAEGRQTLTAPELEQLMRDLAEARSQIGPRASDTPLQDAMRTVRVFPLQGYSPVAIPEDRQIELFLVHPGLGMIGVRLEASKAFEFSARLDNEIAKLAPLAQPPISGKTH